MFQVKLKKGGEATFFEGTHVQSTDLFSEDIPPKLIGHRLEVCPNGPMLEVPRDGEAIYVMVDGGKTIDTFRWPPLTEEEKQARREARAAAAAAKG